MIRAALPTDAAAIAAFWNPFIRDTAVTFNPVEKSPAEISAMIEDRQAAGHGFLVAEQDGTVLGFASYAQFRGGAGYACTMEHTIILSPAAQGTGLGRALMAAVEAHATIAGAHVMIAAVTGENASVTGSSPMTNHGIPATARADDKDSVPSASVMTDEPSSPAK